MVRPSSRDAAHAILPPGCAGCQRPLAAATRPRSGRFEPMEQPSQGNALNAAWRAGTQPRTEEADVPHRRMRVERSCRADEPQLGWRVRRLCSAWELDTRPADRREGRTMDRLILAGRLIIVLATSSLAHIPA